MKKLLLLLITCGFIGLAVRQAVEKGNPIGLMGFLILAAITFILLLRPNAKTPPPNGN